MFAGKTKKINHSAVDRYESDFVVRILNTHIIQDLQQYICTVS